MPLQPALPMDQLPDGALVLLGERRVKDGVRVFVYDVGVEDDGITRSFICIDIFIADSFRDASTTIARHTKDRHFFVKTGDGLFLEPDAITTEEALEAALPPIETGS